MKKLFLILVLGLMWNNAGIAETAKEAAQRNLLNKFKFAIDTIIVGLFFCAIVFIFVKVIKFFTKKDISYKNMYFHAFIGGSVIKVIILEVIK